MKMNRNDRKKFIGAICMIGAMAVLFVFIWLTEGKELQVLGFILVILCFGVAWNLLKIPSPKRGLVDEQMKREELSIDLARVSIDLAKKCMLKKMTYEEAFHELFLEVNK